MRYKPDIKEGLKNLGSIILVSAVIFGVIMYGVNRDNEKAIEKPWIGSIFDKESSPNSVEKSERFKTIEDCRSWATKNVSGTQDYTCGTDCAYSNNVTTTGGHVNIYECSRIEK